MVYGREYGREYSGIVYSCIVACDPCLLACTSHFPAPQVLVAAGEFGKRGISLLIPNTYLVACVRSVRAQVVM